MASISTSRRTTTDLLHISTKRRDPKTAQRSPEHTKIWTEPHPSTNKPRRVPVVYYLSRNGNLEHPHFIEVPLSVSNGLYLRDVIDRLNALRGKEMAASYSWSSKRSYKNGFVWHDLAENDYIYPAHGQEYILKGSELVNSKSEEPVSSLSKNAPDFETHGGDCSPASRHRRNQSCSSIDLHEYKVYSGGSSADAATQTDEKRRRRLATIKPKPEPEIKEDENESSELSREEISPPPSDSSPETLETLMKTDRQLIQRPGTDDRNLKINPTDGNKAKASTVLMQLITCGATSFRDCGPGKDNINVNFSLLSHYKSRMLQRGKNEDGMVENDVVLRKNRRGKKHMVIEDKEYFSGSLIETKKDEFVGLKRSNSCTTNRHKFSI